MPEACICLDRFHVSAHLLCHRPYIYRCTHERNAIYYAKVYFHFYLCTGIPWFSVCNLFFTSVFTSYSIVSLVARCSLPLSTILFCDLNTSRNFGALLARRPTDFQNALITGVTACDCVSALNYFVFVNPMRFLRTMFLES